VLLLQPGELGFEFALNLLWSWCTLAEKRDEVATGLEACGRNIVPASPVRKLVKAA